jgi:hypothetical protein
LNNVLEYFGAVSGLQFADKLVAALIIAKLDSRYAAVSTASDSQDMKTITITKITALLMNEEARQGQDLTIVQANQAKRKPRFEVSSALESFRLSVLLAASGATTTKLETQRQ